MAQIWSCITGPRLYRIYSSLTASISQEKDESQTYIANPIEGAGNKIYQGLKILWYVGFYTSPFILIHLYRRDYFNLAGLISISELACGMGLLFFTACVLRGCGRALNPTYISFLQALQKARGNVSMENKAALMKYDSDFWAWPTDFIWNEAEDHENKPQVFVDRTSTRHQVGTLHWLATLPCNIMAYICAHGFGRHLMYPGSIHLLQAALDQHLQSGREKLIEEYCGQRMKIVTRDGNQLDTMLVDRRKSLKLGHGRTLVVCCEGNAGFYEVGLMTTPLEAGYSVLGWNHPGFAGSSGTPFPSQEQNAVDAVMQLAIHKLGFKPEDIIIYAWSIGGYSGTWAAMNYPQIRGLVLDATFDDVLPLALPRMPGIMAGLVTKTVRQHLNLNVADQLVKYPGPVTIIRRTKDEIITTDDGVLRSNRGNDLLIRLLKARYPKLHNLHSTQVLNLWLSEDTVRQGEIMAQCGVDGDYLLTLLVTYIMENSEAYPVMIGEDMNNEDKMRMLLYLASKYLVDFNSTHNNPLESRYFRMPWVPITDTSFVQVD